MLIYMCFIASKDHSIIYSQGKYRSLCNYQKAKMEETEGESERIKAERETQIYDIELRVLCYHPDILV